MPSNTLLSSCQSLECHLYRQLHMGWHAGKLPNGRRLCWYKPRCVLMTSFAFDSSASGNCWFACHISSLVKVFPPIKILHSWNWILIQLRGFVDSELEVSTNANWGFIRFYHWHDGNSPLRKLHRLQDVLLHQPLHFLLHFDLHGVGHWVSPQNAGLAVGSM